MRGYYRDWIAWSVVAAIIIVFVAEFIGSVSAAGAVGQEAGARSIASLSELVAIVERVWN